MSQCSFQHNYENPEDAFVTFVHKQGNERFLKFLNELHVTCITCMQRSLENLVTRVIARHLLNDSEQFSQVTEFSIRFLSFPQDVKIQSCATCTVHVHHVNKPM